MKNITSITLLAALSLALIFSGCATVEEEEPQTAEKVAEKSQPVIEKPEPSIYDILEELIGRDFIRLSFFTNVTMPQNDYQKFFMPAQIVWGSRFLQRGHILQNGRQIFETRSLM